MDVFQLLSMSTILSLHKVIEGQRREDGLDEFCDESKFPNFQVFHLFCFEIEMSSSS